MSDADQGSDTLRPGTLDEAGTGAADYHRQVIANGSSSSSSSGIIDSNVMGTSDMQLQQSVLARVPLRDIEKTKRSIQSRRTTLTFRPLYLYRPMPHFTFAMTLH